MIEEPPPHPGGTAVFHWNVEGANPPHLKRALPFARAARAAVTATLNRYGVHRMPEWLHHAGPHGDSAYWLTLDTNDDGFIEQIVCIRPNGLGRTVLPGYAAGADVYLGEGPDGAAAGRWRLEPDWMGPLLSGGVIGPARVWVSCTPYITGGDLLREDGKLRLNRDLKKQIHGDLAKRRLPEPFGFTAMSQRAVDGGALEASAFEVSAEKFDPPRGAERAFVRLAFAEAISGPLALGYGAHYGLGLFMPLG